MRDFQNLRREPCVGSVCGHARPFAVVASHTVIASGFDWSAKVGCTKGREGGRDIEFKTRHPDALMTEISVME